MKHWGPRLVLPTLAFGLFTAGAAASRSGSEADQQPQEAAAASRDEGPRQEPVDEFHPDKAKPVEPAYGGRVIVHLPGLPQNMNYTIENSAYTRWMQYEVHDHLVLRNWETWEIEPVVAKEWITEDTLVLEGGRKEGNTNIVYGKVRDDGDHWVIEPLSPGNPLPDEKRVAKKDVERVELETVYTFLLRENVKWHDGHPFNAHDALYSYQVFKNPEVDCDSIRPYYDKIVHGEVVNDYAVRFFFDEQYFNALPTFVDFSMMPSHLYNLKDPDHKDYDPSATVSEQAKSVNENPSNNQWIGLGPYKVVTWSQQGVKTERFWDYYNEDNAGYFDEIYYRHIPNDDTAFQALINGELDFFYRISSSNFFGQAVQQPQFTDNFYKGYFYTGAFNYTPWNMRKPLFKDIRVRKALAHAMDLEGYRDTIAKGLARLPTGPMFFEGPAYNNDVKRLEYDPDKAEELLAEAGWYDRDGDDIIDKDGVKFEFDFQTVSGNKSGALFSQQFQESLAKVGIKMNIVAYEWATYLENIYDRKFDAGSMAWSVPVPESNPLQLWHSDGAPIGVRGSNHTGVSDPTVDKLITEGQRELDDEKRWAMWRELHRYLYEDVQPYLYRLAPPRKFGMNKKIRGMQTFSINPGYAVRRWHFPAGTEGTRSTLKPK